MTDYKSELEQLDNAIKGLIVLRDKFLDDESYVNYLNKSIDALERKQASLILDYEEQKDNRKVFSNFETQRNNREYDEEFNPDDDF